MQNQEKQPEAFDNTEVVEKLVDKTPEKFKDAAIFLAAAIPSEMEIETAIFRENIPFKPGQAPYMFEFRVKMPGAKHAYFKEFNANKILRQIQKEKKYGSKQQHKFTV